MDSLATVAALLGVAVLLVPFFKRAGLGTVLGYLAAGVLIGPSVIGLVNDPESLLHTAELGVVLLLFIIGLELHPARLWALRRSVFGLGSLQFFGIGVLLFGLCLMFGLDLTTALLVSAALTLSSTAFVIPTLAERRELHTRQGRDIFSILLFQDLMVIPLLALLPVLGARTDPDAVSPLVGLLLLAVIVAIGRPVLDWLFRHVCRVDSREMFTAAALATALGLALLLQAGGLSMSLGAFVAGVLLSSSDFRHELEAAIAPFQGLLMGLFFIAVGMGIDLGLLAAEPLLVVGLTLGLLMVKAVGFLLLRWPSGGLRRARIEALALAQCGEFAFVLFGAAGAGGLLDPGLQARLTLAVALSMALAPVLLMLSDRLEARARADAPESPAEPLPGEHATVVIAGFGRVGQIVGRLLRLRRVRFTALDRDRAQVDMARAFGSEAYFGNAAHIDVLHAARLGEARVFVLAIDDVETSLRCAELVRHHFPHVTIVARARNRFHAYRLMDLGVTLIMREAFRSSLDLGRMVFEQLGKPPATARRIIRRFEAHDMALLARQQAVYHDEHQLIQTTREAHDELVALIAEEFDRDGATRVADVPEPEEGGTPDGMGAAEGAVRP